MELYRLNKFQTASFKVTSLFYEIIKIISFKIIESQWQVGWAWGGGNTHPLSYKPEIWLRYFYTYHHGWELKIRLWDYMNKIQGDPQNMRLQWWLWTIKVSSESLWKDGDDRFTTVPLKALSNQVWIRYQCFCLFKLFVFICGFYAFHLRITCL